VEVVDVVALGLAQSAVFNNCPTEKHEIIKRFL
jgi:hypothetical protein